MKEAEREQLHNEFERIREACTRGAAPEGGNFPEWTRDGVESTSEFFDGTAHLWDARFGSTYRFLHRATANQHLRLGASQPLPNLPTVSSQVRGTLHARALCPALE